MWRRTAHFLCVGSALIALLVGTVAIASLALGDGGYPIWTADHQRWVGAASRGSVGLVHVRDLPPLSSIQHPIEWKNMRADAYRPGNGLLGFRRVSGQAFVISPGSDGGDHTKERCEFRGILVPGWLVGGALLAWPTYRWKRAIGRSRTVGPTTLPAPSTPATAAAPSPGD